MNSASSSATSSREGLDDDQKQKIVKEALAKALKDDEDKKAKIVTPTTTSK